MNADTQIMDFRPGLLPELFSTPSLFLSASIPFVRPASQLPSAASRKENARYVRTAQPLRVQDAVAQLCRFAFQQDLSLIFGGHPAISPMVLSGARRFADGEGASRVLIFQSAIFKPFIPQETLELSDWRRGRLFWTAGKSKPGQMPGTYDRDESLFYMRDTMVQSPGLIGAIFIGGMEGIPDEYRRFVQHNPGLPTFAIGSTGSAAAELLREGMGVGVTADEELLSRCLSYPLVMEAIFQDLKLPGHR